MSTSAARRSPVSFSIGGYKPSELGPIPKDWGVRPLKQLTSQIIDGTHFTPKYTTHGIPFLRVTDVQDREISFDGLKYISKLEHQTLIQRCKPQKGDVLLSKNGTIGIPKVVDWDWEFSIFVSLALLRPVGTQLDSNYLAQFFFSDHLDRQIRERSKQGTVTNLHLEEIREFLVPLPPTLSEQQAIANTLSDADTLIEILEELITKKRAIKQGATRELLTGKCRLHGFKEEWQVKPIGPDIELLTGYPFPSAGYSSSGVRLLRGSNVKRGITDWSEELQQFWPSITGELKQYEMKEGDLVIAMDGSLVGRSYARLSATDVPALLLQRVARIRSNKIDIGFLTQVVGSDAFVKHCDAVKTITAIPHISPQNIRSFVMPRPRNIGEQSAIAAVLGDMDAEIDGLTNKLTKARAIKQGMMQELLTGRIRLV